MATHSNNPNPNHHYKPIHSIRRVSYSIPLSTASSSNQSQLPILQIPSPGQARHPSRHFDPRPLIIPVKSNHSTPSPSQSISDNLPRHSLGINAFAIDFSTQIQDKDGPQGILYTGSKDGLVAAWELSIPTKLRSSPLYPPILKSNPKSTHYSTSSEAAESDSNQFDQSFSNQSISTPQDSTSTSNQDIIYENRYEIDQAKLSQAPLPPTTLRQCVQSHTDWCNDIVLCNHNQTLISASSDRTLKAWSPHSPHLALSPITIGSHSDYVKCLAHSRQARWVASGGLDCKIKVWDIHEGRLHPVVNFPEEDINSSIYSLATVPSGSILAAGSPSRVVRLYDPRSSVRLAKLVGHTDNVRALLLSDDGTRLLSASSDATVKLWDVGMQRCLHTFSHHSSSVWALASRHPRLEVFHSGDRTGWVCKVDLEGCGDPSEGECVTLCKVDSDDDKSNMFSSMGNQNVVRIVGMDDTFIWTATGSSSVKRWKDIPTRMQRRQIHGRPTQLPHLSCDTSNDSLYSSIPSSSQPTLIASHEAEESQGLLESDRTPQGAVFQTSSSVNPQVHFPGVVSFADRPILHPYYPSDVSPLSLVVHSNSSSSPSSRTPGRPSVRVTDYFQHQPTTNPAEEATLDGIPLDAMVPLISPNDPIGPTLNHTLAEGQAPHIRPGLNHSVSSSLNLSRRTTLTNCGPSILPVSTSSLDRANGSDLNIPRTFAETAQTSHLDGPSESTLFDSQAWRIYSMRDSATDAIPLRDNPDAIVHGRSGLIKCELLNDRRHVITIDTVGQLALWDIIYCVCKGIFTTEGLSASRPKSNTTRDSSVISSDSSDVLSTSSGSHSAYTPENEKPTAVLATDLLQLVKDRIEGEASIANWCSVEIQTGLLTVHLEESRCFDAEVYADEADIASELLAEMKDDHRICLGKWILKNLFNGFVHYHLKLRHPTNPTGSKSSSTSSVVLPPSTRLPDPSCYFAGGNPSSQVINDHRRGSVPKTPGMTISLATPAIHPALPPDLKSPEGSTMMKNRLGDPGTGVSSRQPLNDSSETHPALPMLVEAPEDEDQPPNFNNSSPMDNRPVATFSKSNDNSSQGSLFPTSAQNLDSRPPREEPGIDASTTGVFNGSNSPNLSTNTNTTGLAAPASIFVRLRGLSRGQKRRQSQDINASSASSTISGSSNINQSKDGNGGGVERTQLSRTNSDAREHSMSLERTKMQNQLIQSIFSKPFQPIGEIDAPKIKLTSDIMILISEAGNESGAWEVRYRGLVKEDEDEDEAEADWMALEMVGPGWLLEYLLGNRTIIKEKESNSLKVTFVLMPIEGGGLNELPNGNARLTAARVLRMRKVIGYISQKLELEQIDETHQAAETQTSTQMKKMEDEIDLICNGTSIPWRMSLGAVKQWVWMKGGDVVINYQLKKSR
ncbi:hypothetical protein DFH28DRAFT_1004490 [Melampsora americana]|nr:hypothetical protein DFH28DRAFT_1004490 [Melampsora americana]